MIRPATIEDAAAIASVHVRTWQHAYAGIISDEFLANLSVVTRTQRWREILADADSTRVVFVAVDDTGQLLGHVSAGPARDDDLPSGTWEIYSVYVDPAEQSRGIGRELMQRALGSAPHGTSRVALWVLTDNHKSRSFYELQGFIADGTHHDVGIEGQHIDEMRYLLSLD